MLKKLRYYGIFFILSLLIASCEVYRLPVSVVQETVTPVPKIKMTLASLEAQAGNTDIIVILGILLFAFIIIPILMYYREWRSS